MIENVRVATVHDITELVRLEATARGSVVGQRGGDERLAELAELGADGFADELSDNRTRVLVSTIDDVIVGYATVSIAGSVARIGAIFVEAAARELGLGELLLADIIAWATVSDADFIEAVALPGDRETKNMYERFGVKARALIVSKPLKPTATLLE